MVYRMIIEMIKHGSGVLVAVDDINQDKLDKFKIGEQYPVEIKRSRNPGFHRKTFSFFKFCFDHWSAEKHGQAQFIDESGQFDIFRKNLTVLAGFYNEFYTIKGSVRIEAKSLSYANMNQDEFEQHYSALINAAIKHIFPGCDKTVEQKLTEFFE